MSSERLSKLAARMLGVDAGVAWVDESGAFLEPTSTFSRQVLETGRSVVLGEVPTSTDALDRGIAAYLGVPVVAAGAGRVLGVLFGISTVPRRWNPEELALALELAELVAARLELSRQRRRTAILHSVLESMGDGVLVLDNSGTLSVANAAAERLLGSLPASWGAEGSDGLGLFFADGVTPIAAGRDPLSRAARGTVSLGVDVVVRNGELPDGERRLTIDAHPVRDQSGAVAAGVAVLRDTTRRRVAEAALQASEERYRLLTEHASDLVRVLTVDRRMIYVSPSSQRLLGYRPDEVLALPIGALLVDDEREMMTTRFDAAVQSGVGGDPLLHRMRCKSGQERWFETSLQPVVSATTGKVSRMHSTSRDITERIEAQHALAEREERMRRLADATFEGIVVAHEGKVIDSNAAFARLFGYESGEVLGASERIFVEAAERARVVQLEAEGATGYRTVGVRKDGSVLPIEVRSQRAPWGEMQVRILAVRDLSAQIAGEQAMRLHGEILASMAESVCLARVSDSLIVYANPRFSQMFGYSSAEVLGLSLDQIRAEGGSFTEALGVLAERDVRTRHETLARKMDGSLFWVRVTVSTMIHPDHGKVIVLVIDDVSARKREAEELARQTGFLELLRSTANEANAATRSADASRVCLQHVCAHMHWPLGRLLSRNGEVLASSAEADQDTLRALARVSSVPVRVGDEVVGTLEFYAREASSEDPALQAVLVDVGLQLGRVVERERARAILERHAAELQALSLVDELTGLRNRRGFLELASHQLQLAARSKRCALLFFADLNGMKEINDKLGHEAGDLALRDTADLLRRSFREADIIARLGGDEFVIYAPNADLSVAPLLHDRLMQHIEHYNLSASVRVSVSLGVASYDPAEPESLDQLLARADNAMYAKKRAAKLQRV